MIVLKMDGYLANCAGLILCCKVEPWIAQLEKAEKTCIEGNIPIYFSLPK